MFYFLYRIKVKSANVTAKIVFLAFSKILMKFFHT